MSGPRDELAAPDVISGGGEDFSAFAVSRWPGLVRLAVATSLRLVRLAWLDAAGHAFASTAALPRSGYPLFQP